MRERESKKEKDANLQAICIHTWPIGIRPQLIFNTFIM